jgi:hypothetical protein
MTNLLFAFALVGLAATGVRASAAHPALHQRLPQYLATELDFEEQTVSAPAPVEANELDLAEGIGRHERETGGRDYGGGGRSFTDSRRRAPKFGDSRRRFGDSRRRFGDSRRRRRRRRAPAPTPDPAVVAAAAAAVQEGYEKAAAEIVGKDQAQEASEKAAAAAVVQEGYEKAAAEIVAKDQAAEAAAKEGYQKAAAEIVAKDQAEAAAKVEAEKADKEAAVKEAAVKEAAVKAAAEKVAKDEAEKAVKEAAVKEAAVKEAAVKEAAAKEAAAKEANTKENATKGESPPPVRARARVLSSSDPTLARPLLTESNAKEAQAKAVERANKESAAKEQHAKAVAAAQASCGPGHFYTTPFACDPCAAGTYQGGTGQTSCKNCLAGTASAGGAAKCTACTPDVDHSPADRAEKCIAVRSCLANGETATPGTATTDRVCTCSKGHVGEAQNPSACSACEQGSHAPGAGHTSCTACAAGKHAAAKAMSACVPCEVNDALDATHVGFAKDKGARGCTKHRVCTPPTAVNGAGEYQTKPASPHHDRECAPLDVCGSHQYISLTETAATARVCTACPFNYKATDDFSACYAYRCSHVKCKHTVHKCSVFNTVAQHRAPGTMTALLSHKNECDDTKRFQTTVTLHHRDENTCHNGHWCGMGVISGDKTKCQCAPLNLKPAAAVSSSADTPDKGWTGHADALKALHPDATVVTGGLAGAGTPDARDAATPVEYLGARSAESP